MTPTPTFYFFVINRDRGAMLQHQGPFVPRVGDTIEIAGFYLKVVDVVIQSAQSDGLGIQHSLYVHTKEAEVSFDESAIEELELDEFCRRMENE